MGSCSGSLGKDAYPTARLARRQPKNAGGGAMLDPSFFLQVALRVA